jgi:hypothetical protein
MAGRRVGEVLRRFQDLLAKPTSGEVTDRQLLQRFASQHDERAFASLVRRHGPLVLGVGRRILRQDQDAEDVFQATFLILARKAASTRWQPSVAGTADTFTITAQDAFSNTATGYTGTVHFTSSDAQATVPADYTFTGADAGVHTFSATLVSAGTQSVTATDTVTSSITGTESSLVITPAPASRFTVAGFPTSVVAGTAGNFIVTAFDAYGNTATNYTGTVQFSSSDTNPAHVLSGPYTFTSGDAGTHTFSATLVQAGTQSFTATDAVNSSVTGSQTGIVITPAVVTHFRVYGFVNPTLSGAAHDFIVQAKDAYGNVVPGYTGTVVFTGSDSQATLPGLYPFSSADGGTHTFSATLFTVGTQSITVTDTGSNSITGVQTGIVVNAAGAAQVRGRVPEAGPALVQPLPNSGSRGTAPSILAPAIPVLPASTLEDIADFAVLLAGSGGPGPGIPRASKLDALGDLLAPGTRDLLRLHRVATDQRFDFDGDRQELAPGGTSGHCFSATAWFDQSDSAG